MNRFFLVLFLQCLGPATALVYYNKVQSDKNWVFVEKFCYDSRAGLLRLTPNLPDKEAADHSISFYADAGPQWPQTYKITNCTLKNSFASLTLNLSKYNKKTTKMMVTGTRPRWWFVAVSNCKGTAVSLTGTLNLTFTSAESVSNSVFVRHFGYNEQDMYQSCIFFVIWQLLLLPFLYHTKTVAKKLGKQYLATKALSIIVASTLFARLSEIVNFYRFSTTGLTIQACVTFAYLFDCFSDISTLTLVIDIANGWTISTNVLAARRLKFFVILATGVVYLVLFWWVNRSMDKASTKYMYDSDIGYTIVALRIAAMVYFWFCCLRSYRAEREIVRRKFYVWFGVIVTVWFVSVPVIVFYASGLMDWERKKTVYNVQHFTVWLFQLFLWFLFRPWACCTAVEAPVLDPSHQRPHAPQTGGQVFPLSALAAIVDEEAAVRRGEEAAQGFTRTASSRQKQQKRAVQQVLPPRGGAPEADEDDTKPLVRRFSRPPEYHDDAPASTASQLKSEVEPPPAYQDDQVECKEQAKASPSSNYSSPNNSNRKSSRQLYNFGARQLPPLKSSSASSPPQDISSNRAAPTALVPLSGVDKLPPLRSGALPALNRNRPSLDTDKSDTPTSFQDRPPAFF